MNAIIVLLLSATILLVGSGCENPLDDTSSGSDDSSIDDNPTDGDSPSPPSIPDIPTNLSIYSAGETFQLIQWDYSFGITSYQLYRNDSPSGSYAKIYDGSSTIFLNDGLTGGSTYYYKVRATNSAGSSGLSDYVAGTTIYVDRKPATPTGLTVSNPTYFSLRISWDYSLDVSSYELYRSTSASGGYTLIDTGLFFFGYTDGNLAGDTTYFYKVQAINSYGSSDLSDYASGTTLPAPPTTPTGLTVFNPTGDTLDVSWNPSESATSYSVYSDTDPPRLFFPARLFRSVDKLYRLFSSKWNDVLLQSSGF